MKPDAVEAQRLHQALRLDYEMEGRMIVYDNNFYGLKHLMPLIETLAYISLEVAWPKPKQ